MTSPLSPLVGRPTSYYRRLVYTAALGLLSDADARRAAELCNLHVSAQRTFSPLRFARALRGLLGISTETAKTLAFRLDNLGWRPEDELEPDPIGQSKKLTWVTQLGPRAEGAVKRPIGRLKKKSRTGLTKTTKSPQHIVFELALSDLLNRSWQHRTSLEIYLFGLTGEAEAMLSNWCQAATPYLQVPRLARPEMTDALGSVYDWYCNLYSETYARGAFTEAAARCTGVPELLGVNPLKVLSDLLPVSLES